MKYRGVVYHRRDGYYRVKLKKHGTEYFLANAQTLDSPETAARIYDVAAEYLHGPDAVLNFNGDPPPGISKGEILHWLLKTLEKRGIPGSTLYVKQGK
jgi:hypothetical protein